MIWSVEGLVGLLGIAAPALVMVAVIHRWVERIDWKTVSFSLALALVAIGPSVYREVLPVPVDEVARGFPYRGVLGEPQVGNALTNDTTRQMLPWMQLVRESFARFEAPLWNPSSFSGYPLLGNGQSAPFSPFFVATLFVSLPYQIISMAGLKYFVALFFGVLLFRKEGLSAGAAIAGAAVFALSVFQTVYLYYPMTAVTSLLPALLYFIAVTIDEPHPGSGRVGLAIVTASILAGGHPESALHCALGASIFLCFKVMVDWKERRTSWWPLSRAVLLPVVIGILLSAPAWLPFVEQALHSDRIATLSEQSMTPAHQLSELAIFGHPDRVGNPALGNWKGPANYSVVAPTYAGLVLAVLAFASLLARGVGIRRKFFIVAGFGLYCIALGWTPLSLLNQIPPLAWAANDRLRFVGLLFMALGAMPLLDRERSEIRLPSIVAAVAALSLWWFSWGHQLTGISRVTDVIGPGVIMATALILLLPALTKTRFVGLAVATLIIMEMLALNRPFNAPCDVAYFRPDLPIIEAVHQHANPSEPIRMVGKGWTLLPNASGHYGLEDIRGSDPMAWRPYLDFLDGIAHPKHQYGIRRVTSFPQAALDFLGVRYVLASPGSRRPAGYTTLYSGPDGELWLNPKALPRFSVPTELLFAASRDEALKLCRKNTDFRESATIEGPSVAVDSPDSTRIENMTRNGPGDYELEIKADGPGLIVSSIPAVPGWRLKVNNTSRLPATVNSAFIGIPVRQGDSLVELRYRPRSFTLALVFFLLGLVMLTCEGGISLIHRTRQPSTESW